ncbi:hypothetical protein ACSSV5_001570 [Psychroflexus sp. MBR-150]
MRIIHLTTNEKFIDEAMFIYNKAFSDQNQLLFLKPLANPPTKYISQSEIYKELVKNRHPLTQVMVLTKNADWIIVYKLNETEENLYTHGTQVKFYMWFGMLCFFDKGNNQ